MRQVVDGATKQPLANAYVILTFSGDFFAGVENRHRCYQLDVEETDADGHFPFPSGRRSLNPFLSDAEVAVALYKPGYRTVDHAPAAADAFEMVVDTRPWRSNPQFGIQPIPTGAVASKPGTQVIGTPISPVVLATPPQARVEARDASLQAIVSQLSSCGWKTDTRKETVLAAMYDEVRSMDPVDWGFLSDLLYEIETIQNGGEVDRYGGNQFGPAYEHRKQRAKQLERRSPNVGEGELWQIRQFRGRG